MATNTSGPGSHPADRLLARIDRLKAPVCVGLDPVFERLPDELRRGSDDLETRVSAIASFSCFLIEAVCEQVPCLKIQAACFERYGYLGVKAMGEVMRAAEASGIEVILDFKRGDIGISADHYAASAFDPPTDETCSQPGWVTINAYLGADGIKPFLLRPDRGAFALVRTSNPSSDAIQERKLDDGRTVAEAVAGEVASIGSAHIGQLGYSSLGAVVGATKPRAAVRLREIMPEQLFLVPGFGAQGGGEDDVKPCFKADGTGAIITASRAVIYAFEPGDANWRVAVTEAAAQLAERIGIIAGLR